MHPEEAGRGAYHSNTLVGNWYEDRFLPTDTKLNTTERIFSRDLGQPIPGLYQTTKQAAEAHVQAARSTLKAVHKPSLYPEQQVQQRLQTYLPGGQPPDAVAFTLGRNAIQACSQDSERHLHTTNTHFYQDLPQQAVAKDPSLRTSGMNRSHFRTSTVRQELQANAAASEPAAAGGKGLRGEITRHPREGGNPYGVHVFVDEYAQWGRKLAGKMTLGETVARKMTSYF